MNSKTMSSFEDLKSLKTKIDSPNKKSQATQAHRKKITGFNISLKRKMEVKRYPILARLVVKRERKDLASLLKAILEKPDKMPKRLVMYLQREKLWDKDTASLTEKGQDVLDSGCLDENEEGLYHIWYSVDDALLGTRPLFIQRDTAFFEPDVSRVWKEGVDAANAGFEVNTPCEIVMLEETYRGRNNELSETRSILSSLNPVVICSQESSGFLDLEWELGLENSVVSLQGNLEACKFSNNKITTTLQSFDLNIEGYQEYLNELMNDVASQFNGQWDEKDQRMAVELSKVRNYPNVVQKFELDEDVNSVLSTRLGQFDRVEISNFPVKPTGFDNALEWHKEWLNNFHSKNYRNTNDSYEQQAKWLDHKAIAGFDLVIKSGQELLTCFSREKHSKSHWHVAAMMDLSPARSKKQRLPITLMHKDNLSIHELIDELTSDNVIQHMIYSDRYVHTARQSRNLSSIASCVSGASGLLMTLAPPPRKTEADLPPNWRRVVFEKHVETHGRYWIFIGESHNWYWECTSGLDFIKDNDSGFNVEGAPSFIPKEKDELPKYLQEAIDSIKTLEGV